MSRRTRVAAGAVVSAVLLVALLWFTDPREIWRTLAICLLCLAGFESMLAVWVVFGFAAQQLHGPRSFD